MLELIRPTASLKQSYLEALAEFHAERRFLYHRLDVLQRNFDAHVQAECALIHWENIALFRVPETIYWLADDDTFVGRFELRHRLDNLADDIGGHIGYSIRPGRRRQGYGAAILKLGLEKAAQRGLSRVLLTCDPDNTASRKIIEKNGGLFEKRIERMIDGVLYCKLRYWIEVPIAHPAGLANMGAERKTGHQPGI
ncbi:GNAT family N-acetyltransferase [Bradymonas sediminis]|uniref:GNAT family N-acetyltransferase n=1 Tax=Bradymonas sediminis TaxID=1548548 RepID=A0A2Z4FP39_9DELT|nr:GNAT family N-acetyltransferase [Bradymonas sediminis]AWV90640.1 GNAT family N-acetyltransferase [Bradymonas sediminis]TDP62357.1 putative acetyltransferase [Bradymonas sediminis]